MKTCIKTNCQNPIWARKLCKFHDKIENPSKYKVLTKNKPYQSKKSSKPIKHISDNMIVARRAYNKARDEYMATHTVCEFQGCNMLAEDLHHIRGRVGKYLTDASNFMAVCRYHHQWIHENDTEARKLGYLKSRISTYI